MSNNYSKKLPLIIIHVALSSGIFFPRLVFCVKLFDSFVIFYPVLLYDFCLTLRYFYNYACLGVSLFNVIHRTMYYHSRSFFQPSAEFLLYSISERFKIIWLSWGSIIYFCTIVSLIIFIWRVVNLIISYMIISCQCL